MRHILLCSTLLASPALAQDNSGSDNSEAEIVVTAQRMDASRDSIDPSVGAQMSRFDRTDLDIQPGGADLSLKNVLLQSPGVSQDSDGDGEIHVRNEHGNVQYRLNGITVPQGFAGFGALVDPRVANSIEVLTGALPAQYGFRTSGVVNMKTRTDSFDFDGDVGIYAGSNGTWVPSFTMRDSTGRLNYFLSGSYQQNDLGIANPLPGRKAIHDRSEQWRGFGYASYILGNSDRVTAFGGTATGRFQMPNQPGLAPAFTYNGQTAFDSTRLDQNQRQNAWFGVFAYQHTGDTFDFQIAPFYRFAKARFMPDASGGNLMFNGVDTDLTQTSVAWGVQADASKKLGESHTLRFGLFFQHDRTRSDSINRVFALDALGNQASDTPIVIAVPELVIGKNIAAYLQDEWQLSDTLTLNLGLRFDHSTAQVTENQLSPRVGLVWTPDDSTVVHLGYARYFTPPPLALIGKGTLAAFDGTTGEIANKVANPIRSERDHLFDIGLQRQLLSHLTVTIDLYYKTTSNLLDDTTLGGTLILSPFNYARARNWGIELSASYAQGPFQAYFNAARGQQQAKAIDSNEFLFDAGDLAYIRDHYIYTDHSQKWTLSGGASLNLPDGIGHLQPAMDFIFGSGLRKDDPAGIVPNGGTERHYLQVNFGIAQVIGSNESEGFTIRFDVINLFDASILLHDGSGVGAGQPEYSPRRAFYVGLRKAF